MTELDGRHQDAAHPQSQARRQHALPEQRRQGTEAACRSEFTPAELKVLIRIARGLTDEAVASACNLSPHTVRHHVASAMRRAAAQSRTELVAKCFAGGVLAAAWPPALNLARCLCRIEGLEAHA